MNQNLLYYCRRTARITVVTGLVLFVGSQAYADVVGRLQFTVKNVDDEKPIAGASIVITDPTNVHPAITLKTDASGAVTTSPLENHNWTIKTSADNFNIDTRSVRVVADTITPIEIDLEPVTEKVIKVSSQVNVTRPNNASQATIRDRTIVEKFPVSPGNNQSLTNVLRTTPGLAPDSVGQLHPEGEHSSTSIYLNGFQLPGAFQGRFGQILSPTSIQSVEVLTGGYAPEYGRETAAILNVQLRSGPIQPFLSYSLTGGTYATYEGGLIAGGQFGSEFGAPDDQNRRARRFAYLLNVDTRNTNNAVEPPQPDNQTAHNSGNSFVSFGNFDWRPSSRDTLSLTISDNPAQVEVANRTGLPAFFAPFGQGYGFQGAQPASSGLLTQQQLGQDDYQQDHNEFGVLNYLRDVNSHTQARLSFGMVHNDIDVLNHNPAIDLSNLPPDSSIEFNPTLIRNSRDAQGQGSITSTVGRHTFKAGFTIDRQSGLESYELIPASQAALSFLNDPNNGLTLLAPVGTMPSVVSVARQGWYNAGYLQDTWRVSKALTANYGLRLDDFLQTQATAQNGGVASVAHVGLQMLEPRLNLAYALPGQTVLRASYNRLMIIPPSAQGAAPGVAVVPEKINQFEGGVEHQTGPGQSVRIKYYEKDIVDQLDTGLLVPGTQIGAFVTNQIPKDIVKGTELSYNLFPSTPFGWDAFLSYANALAKTRNYVVTYNDHDQLNTISAGANYTFKNGQQAGLVFNYGSGFASSVVDPTTGKRTPHKEVNLRLASGPIWHGSGIVFEVQNLFDERNVNNFNSGFSGTRFQQGRRLLLTWSGKF